ncbi:alpha/beta fold hydrolase [Gordonia hydrophobica]|uniref:Alpha/beta hydrolase n=1 Tax=Gordonia hydrophobica TaxID=40516 RepID=A0ABZ2TZK4_9ACTN|nr:alpha/beta fold hydrolase [Gordonia hydrophobica]MBM7366265.1 polyhydroxyalkanoate synthase [Gordonia hydrophobica]
MSIVESVRREVERNALRARNGIKMAAGISSVQTGLTPRDRVWQNGRAALYRYRNDDVRYRPPLLVVFSVVSKAYILDLTPGNSFVEHLLAGGFDVYLLEWGEADERDARNGFEYYVDGAIPAAVREVCKRSKVDEVSLIGYCFGGVLTLLHGAHHPDAPIRSHTVMACPVDYARMPLALAMTGGDDLETILGDDGNVPADVVFSAFRSLKPTADITGYVDLLEKLWNDDYVQAYQAMNGWASDHVPMAGELARQISTMLVEKNGFVEDDLVLGGDRVSLKSITVPFMAVFGEKDHIVPADAASPVLDLIGSEQKTELRLTGGHIGLVVGRTAAKTTVPTIIEFLQKQSEEK